MRLPLLIACLGLTVLATSPAQAQKVRHRRDVITAEEIASRPGLGNAYDLIRSLRSAWFTGRGAASARDPASGGIVVYRDGVPIGGTEELRQISSDQIQEMRFLSASDATMKYGTGHPSGAIEVTTKH